MTQLKRNGLSSLFLRTLQSPECQCGRFKKAFYPLCGVCFLRLEEELKADIRLARGFEFEIAYNTAVEVLKYRKTRRDNTAKEATA
ncbi:MAG: hypothetical protein IPN69_08065 [Acidobacteria bacterium]|nr:hypothetical protein [Acidobacteriota bacterium]